MAYNKDIPQPTEAISDSQPKILANFQAIDAWTAVDHVGFDLADEGKHNKVTLVAQSPAPSFTGTELGVYNFVNPATSKNEIYVTKYNNNVLNDIPITASSFNNAVGTNSGYSYLPSGLILQWCTLSVTANKNTENSYPFTFPLGGTKTIAFPNGILSLNVSQVDNVSAGVFLTISKSDTNKFDVKTYATLSTESITVRCLIIGY